MIYTPLELKRLLTPMIASGKDPDVIADVIVDEVIMADRTAHRLEIEQLLEPRGESVMDDNSHVLYISGEQRLQNKLLIELQEGVERIYETTE